MTIKDIKLGDLLTLNAIEEPDENQVWVRGSFDKESKTYSITNWADNCREKFLRPDKEVFTDFIF